MPPHQVLHLLDTSGVDGIGIARIVAALAEGLDPGRYKMHTWFCNGNGPLAAILESKGVMVRSIDWRDGVRDPVGMWRFIRAIQGSRFALVHQHFGGRSVRWISRHIGGARIITHLHGRVLEQSWETPFSCNVDGADAVIATSAAVARWSCANAAVVYPGVDNERYNYESVMMRDRTGFVIGVAGRLVPVKGIDCLLRALPLVRVSLPSARLEIAGTGPGEPALRDEVHRLGLDDCVRFLGWQDDIPFHRWNILAVPSYEEAFGLAALEAMAAGLPVVASAVGGLTELVADGKTGLLFPASDHHVLAENLVFLLGSPHTQQEMGVSAWARSKDFTTRHMCEEIERIYTQVLI